MTMEKSIDKITKHKESEIPLAPCQVKQPAFISNATQYKYCTTNVRGGLINNYMSCCCSFIYTNYFGNVSRRIRG